MPKNEPLRRSMAYVQFLAQLEEIKLLLAQGYSKKLIHERLTGKKHISMAYVTFCPKIKDQPMPQNRQRQKRFRPAPGSSMPSKSRFPTRAK